MIVAERKKLEEIAAMVKNRRKILIIGCGTCVTVCMAGGEKEVGILASSLKMLRSKEGNPIEVAERTIERQCEWEFVDDLAGDIAGCDAAISMACGAGVQAVATRFPLKQVFPALNTKFIGMPEKHGLWVETCGACGDCVLDRTGGVCPIARCSKSLLNGPCGGSQNGKCEISKDLDCAWQLICDRLKELGRLDELYAILPPKNWSAARDGGPRRVVREDVML